MAEEIEMTGKCSELLWAKITLANHHPMYILQQWRLYCKDLTKKNPNALIAVGGEINASGVDWKEHIVTSECRDKNSCSALIDTFNKFSLTQLQRSPTREDVVLDLFATNKPGLIRSCRDIPGISDHSAVIIDADIEAQTSRKLPRKVYQWRQADWATMREEATAFSKTFPWASADRSVAENYHQIEKLIKSMLRHVPIKMIRTSIHLPWLSQALKHKCKAKQRLYNRVKKNGKPEHNKHYTEAQKSSQNELKKARWQHINNILCTNPDQGNHKTFWKYIRSQREDNVGVAPLKEDGRLQASNEAKTNILAKHFKLVFTDDKHDSFSETRLHGPTNPLIRACISATCWHRPQQGELTRWNHLLGPPRACLWAVSCIHLPFPATPSYWRLTPTLAHSPDSTSVIMAQCHIYASRFSTLISPAPHICATDFGAHFPSANTPAPIKANLMNEQLSVQMSWWRNGGCTCAGSQGDQQTREFGPWAARHSRAMMRANAWSHDELRKAHDVSLGTTSLSLSHVWYVNWWSTSYAPTSATT